MYSSIFVHGEGVHTAKFDQKVRLKYFKHPKESVIILYYIIFTLEEGRSDLDTAATSDIGGWFFEEVTIFSSHGSFKNPS